MSKPNDLFLSEEAKDTVPRRSVATILAEDEADLAELEKLSHCNTSYKKISYWKEKCAWGFVHKKFVAGLLGGVSFFAVAAGVTIFYWTQNAGVDDGAIQEATRTVPSISSEPAAVERDRNQGDQASENIRVMTEKELKLLEALFNQKKMDKGALSPVTDIQIGPTLQTEGDKKPLSEPKVVNSIAVPINTVTVHEGEAQLKSASDIIDSMGIGSEGVGEHEGVDGVNSAVPDQKRPKSISDGEVREPSEIRFQIVDRDGEKAGFQRMKNGDPKTTQWFLVIEALNEEGVAQEMPVMDMDDGEIRVVRKWAIQVEEDDFEKFSAEKKKSGKIAEPTIGSAPSDKTQPTWTVGVTGDMLTKWD